MKSCTNTDIKHPNKCLVITSSLSLSCYPISSLSSMPGSYLLYSCFDGKSVVDVPVVDSYEIVLDFDNPKIGEIIFTLFNKLLSTTNDISVMAIHCVSKCSSVTASELATLKRLRDHGLIRLEILDSTEIEHTAFSTDIIENTTCFIGPGNTGKTSILSSISEVFTENRQSIALLDLTQTHKLAGYFTDSLSVSGVMNFFSEGDQWDIPYNYIDCNEFVSLYTIENTPDKPYTAPILVYKLIEYLSKIYDQVVINADSHTLERFKNIFNCINRVFIVYDLIPTKIDLSYQLLLKLNGLGLTARQNTSIIYNKVEKRASDIQFFEESVIFERSEGDKLTPLIDVQCNTFEILYSKRTMGALVDKFKSQKQTLRAASKNYIRNITNIYKLMNNIKYHESYDMQVIEFLCCYSKKLTTFIPFDLIKRAIGVLAKKKSELYNNYTHSV